MIRCTIVLSLLFGFSHAALAADAAEKTEKIQCVDSKIHWFPDDVCNTKSGFFVNESGIRVDYRRSEIDSSNTDLSHYDATYSPTDGRDVVHLYVDKEVSYIRQHVSHPGGQSDPPISSNGITFITFPRDGEQCFYFGKPGRVKYNGFDSLLSGYVCGRNRTTVYTEQEMNALIALIKVDD